MEIKISSDELRKRKLFLGLPCYGGNCSAVFARSIADLTAACTHYGIAVQMYFLMNESLIQRARNYICDEFMRSDATHLMFIDSDIGFNPQDIIMMLALSSEDSEYDVLCGPYPKKSVSSKTKIITENEGEKTIKWICDNKYSGRVLSQNSETGNFSFEKVIAWHVSNDKNKKWVQIRTKTNYKDLIVTSDHECYIVDDILFPKIYKKEAKDIKNKYLVALPTKQISGKNNINELYTSDQISFLVGTLLGDGSIRKGYLTFGHSNKQYDYLNLKQKLFGGTLSDEKVTGTYKDNIYYGKFLDCPRNSQIDYLQKLFYQNGKKTVKEILNLIDEKSLAFWYMDDGNLCQIQETCQFCCEGFSNNDVKLLQKFLNEKWNIKTTINSNRLYVLKQSNDILFSLISEYVINELEYKLPKKYREKKKYQFKFEKLPYAAVLVKDIIWDNCNTKVPMKQYDITVENNHNFVANRFTVSNCISWEKIKVAVDKGFADEDANKLDKFVGDYVFNPKNGKGEIKLGEPAEVLESGTGFMMIQRRVFEKFQKAYPQQAYKPDHVRTEHFDGSRMIFAYFDCVVDHSFDFGDTYKLLKEISEDDADVEKIKSKAKEMLTQEKEASKRYLSEDYFFCQKIQKAGMKVWLLPWVQLTHIGSYMFGGSLIDIAQLGVTATADPEMLKKKVTE